MYEYCYLNCLRSVLWSTKATEQIASGERFYLMYAYLYANKVITLLAFICLSIFAKFHSEALRAGTILEIHLDSVECYNSSDVIDECNFKMGGWSPVKQKANPFYQPQGICSFIRYEQIYCLESTFDITSYFFVFTFRSVSVAMFLQSEKLMHDKQCVDGKCLTRGIPCVFWCYLFVT